MKIQLLKATRYHGIPVPVYRNIIITVSAAKLLLLLYDEWRYYRPGK